jgi:2-oxoglutarate ferredoxin oxidoreductase subunit alpha
MNLSEISLVLAGEAGQGIQSIEHILTKIVKKSGLHVFATKEYMSRVRGGVNSTEIRVSENTVRAYVDRIDVLVGLNAEALSHLSRRIGPQTLILGERAVLKDERVTDLPFSQWTQELGSPLYANTIAVGLCTALVGVDRVLAEEFLAAYFSRKGLEVVEANLKALGKGFEEGVKLRPRVGFQARRDPAIDNKLMLTGAEAVALGALAGGCNYACAYPMSPGTSVLETLASYSKKMDILVEQVEDEIGVVNMAIGAWYAGARALVTTSGGGFALMTEGVSLAGITESPLVVHIAQRPGPGTGLPTKTEQADLHLAINAGHGEFLRIVLAPATIEEGYELTRQAFGLADHYQVPVFLLTDQFFVDSYYDTEPFVVPGVLPRSEVVTTSADYKRYALTSSGLSPRGIPGHGQGLVKLDSDEHTEEGLIAEDEETRNIMNAKRLSRFELVKADILEPRLTGQADYDTLVVSWGSTGPAVQEALDGLALPKAAHLHFSWVWPLPESTADYLRKAKKVLVVEQNATGQLADLIQMRTCVPLPNRLLKSSGIALSVEELSRDISTRLKEATV